MINNSKPISRKKSLQLIPSKQSKQITQSRLGMKNKKSTSNLLTFKNQSSNNQQKILAKSKSKSKIQRNCQNFNHLNLQKKYPEHQQSNNDNTNRMSKTNVIKIEKKDKDIENQDYYQNHNNYAKTTHMQQQLAKSKSTSKLKLNKTKKCSQPKIVKDKSKIKQPKQKQSRSTVLQTDRLTHKKSVNSLIDKKPSKNTGKSKQKLKQKKKSINQSKQKKPKLSKISQIIPRSIIYSDYKIKENGDQDIGQEYKYYESMGMNYPIQYISLQEPNCNFCCRYQSKEDMNKITNSAIIIQKTFRGYIQRKYILEARYIIDCVKKIQRFWRKILKNKQKNTNRNAQISSSLITIKDLNDTYKQDKFKSQLQHKQKTSSKQDLQKIVKNLLEQDGLNESLKQKIRNVIGKQSKIQQKEQKKQQISITKEQYAKKLINKQIFSQKIFNSPMNSKQNSLLSPGFHNDFLSPKCFSSSQKKEKQAISHYSERFKNSKTPLIVSPKKQILEQNKKPLRILTGQQAKQNNSNQLNSSQKISNQNQKIFNSKLKSQQQSNFLYSYSQKSNKNSQNKINKFETSFSTIEQFCFLIIDFLRENIQSTEVLIEKLKALKYQKIESIFKQLALIKGEQFSEDDNSQFQEMLMKQDCQKPCIFSKYQRKIILESPSIRLFLNQNNYSDDDITNSCSPQFAYINFMFNVFEESIYQSFKGYNLTSIFGCNKHYNQTDENFLNNVLSQALGNILDCASMLCGSFCDENATQSQREDKILINNQRITELTHKFEEFDIHSCEMWCKLQIFQAIFQQMVQECAKIKILR